MASISSKTEFLHSVIKWITIFFALATILFSLSTIIGWHFHLIQLIQYKSNTVAIVYNTAMCFLMLGFSALFLVFELQIIAQIIAVLVFVFSLALLLQHILGINLHIDNLFFEHYHTIANRYAGRVAPNTATCFIFSAITLFFLACSRFKNICIVIGGTFSVLTLSLSILFVSGYLVNLQQAYFWGSDTPIAISTAIGFLLLSPGLIALTLYQIQRYKMQISKSLVYFSPLAILIVAILLAEAIYSYQAKMHAVTSLPIVTVFLGGLFAILFGLVLNFALKAFTKAKIAENSLSLLRATFDATEDGILSISYQDINVTYNSRFLKMWGLCKEQLELMNPSQIFQLLAKQVENKKAFLERTHTSFEHSTEKLVTEVKLKTHRYFELYSRPQTFADDVIGEVWCFHNITSQKKLQEELTKQATSDTLTGLPNRVSLLSYAEKMIEVTNTTQEMFALFLLDIDRFSVVNDVFGRSAGDEIIRLFANKLQGALSKQNLLGRIVGDEFVIISRPIQKIQDAVKIIKNIMNSSSSPISYGAQQVNMTFSVGIALYPKDGDNIDTLLGNADAALSLVKKQGRNGFQLYTDEMNAYTLEYLKLENELRQAVRNKEFILYYQPLVILKSEKIIGFESLIRWQHPEKGLIMPDKFIPIAEEIGLIQEIGDWVLGQACHDLKVLEKLGYGHIKFAVNVSAQQFRFSLLLKTVNNLLEQTGVSPKLLELELTERILIHGSEEVYETLNELKSIGVTVSLDDFGTGYSSLSYLKRFNIDKIKIDRSFVKDLVSEEEDKSLTKTIIMMGKSLSIKVLTEGIETREQLDILKRFGCEFGQGFYFSKALPLQECITLLRSNMT